MGLRGAPKYTLLSALGALLAVIGAIIGAVEIAVAAPEAIVLFALIAALYWYRHR